MSPTRNFIPRNMKIWVKFLNFIFFKILRFSSDLSKARSHSKCFAAFHQYVLHCPSIKFSNLLLIGDKLSPCVWSLRSRNYILWIYILCIFFIFKSVSIYDLRKCLGRYIVPQKSSYKMSIFFFEKNRHIILYVLIIIFFNHFRIPWNQRSYLPLILKFIMILKKYRWRNFRGVISVKDCDSVKCTGWKLLNMLLTN